MEKKSIPKFYGLRVYISSVMLYFFLVIPFIGFIIFQNVPKFIENNQDSFDQATSIRDSVQSALDSIPGFSQEEIDSLVSQAILMAESTTDTVAKGSGNLVIAGPNSDGDDSIKMFAEKGPFASYFILLFILLFVSDIVGFFYNRPFKRYFRRKRNKKEIPEKLHTYCKKHLLRTPLFNSLIVTMPNIVVFIYSMIFLVKKVSFDGEVEREMFIQLHYLTLVATTLEILFVYYWQKHRVHIRYIDHIYSETELRKKVFKKKGGKIRNRLMMASGMTTLLPLLIVTVYLVLSLTSVKDLNLETFSREQREILFGPWSTIVGADKETVPLADYEKLYFVNAIDSIVMLVGIGNGILVSFIYLLLFIRWTNRDVTGPVKELLANIRNTRGGEAEQYTIVRTNDEIGELAEGYNEMTQKIHNYVESISSMNRDLEKKVKERTKEVVEQKEEIETQKEEIEAQLDLATLQRDTIAIQKDQILDSIHYAERIQSAILPPEKYLTDHLSDHFLLFKPRDIVSGDFYWTMEKNQKLMVAVADCTGHGVPGAFLSMLGIASMNEIVNRSKLLKPDKILEQLREILIKSLHQTGTRGEAQDGIEIALCVIDLKKLTLEYSGANRPLYIVRDGAVEHIRPDRMPIGIYEQEPVPFTNHTLELKKEDSIYLFSDGYVDQLGGPLRKTFRVKKFRKLLIGIQDQSMDAQKQILLTNLDEWQGEVEQIDDILVMGIRI
ncbi:MAG: SpoIIE family protein phosphatase [Bacteroidales bacterium]|nr:SpoIIE family protein phosphatase [Bacteroidales bacterium]